MYSIPKIKLKEIRKVFRLYRKVMECLGDRVEKVGGGVGVRSSKKEYLEMECGE